MKFFAIMAKMTPQNMEALARKVKKIFPDIPFYRRVDYSRRVSCHGYSWTMSDEERAKAGDLIGEEDKFIPEVLQLTPSGVWVKGRYAKAHPTEEPKIDILYRTDSDNTSGEVIKEVPFNHPPINVLFGPY